MIMDPESLTLLSLAHKKTLQILSNPTPPPLPSPSTPLTSTTHLHTTLPPHGLGLQSTHSHLSTHILPSLSSSSLSPHYYGFVTGGITPAARLAETYVSLYDQNLFVHLPEESIATTVEDRALILLLDLLRLEPRQWEVRVLTTGATGSNFLGLACGREWVLNQRLGKLGKERVREGEGMLGACRRAGVKEWRVLSERPHSSLVKGANVLGLGGEGCVSVAGDGDGIGMRIDLGRLEKELKRGEEEGWGCIVVVSCAEVNFGGFGTRNRKDMEGVRAFCDRYGAWLHVDAAFGIFARALPSTPFYASLHSSASGLELADSITGDAHKIANVPYDCGFFFSRHLDISLQVFKNPNAAYLKSAPSSNTNDTGVDTIPSPANLGIENSKRFRGLPLYATLIAYGRNGYADMVSNMVQLARGIARCIRDECPHLELLPRDDWHGEEFEAVFIIVLFRAREEGLNGELVKRINESRRIYVSPSEWEGRPATRFAVAKWDVVVGRDLEVVRSVLVGLR